MHMPEIHLDQFAYLPANLGISSPWHKKSITPIKIYIEDIYFFEVNTKYISSTVMKISVNSRVHSMSEISDIFNT